MSRFEALWWGGVLAVLALLFFGLDPYRRQPLDDGYGPDRRQMFETTLEKARELDVSGRYRIGGREKWHRLHGFEADEDQGTRVVNRRGIFLLPVRTPRFLEVSLQLKPIPETGKEAAPVEIEYGVNGEALGRQDVPAGGGAVRFRIAPSALYCGDNTVFLYRLTRRAEPTPWLRVAEIQVQAAP